jgi:alpha-mannosidase
MPDPDPTDRERNGIINGRHNEDPVWLWRRREGYAEIKATFQSALDRMEESPNYIFTSACAAYYEWVEQNEPAMFEKIKERVAEGRWAIAGGMWVQPDCNMPSGESFARHLLYSQRYFLEKFGRIATAGYNVDSFGHNGMLPQLLRKAGISSYVFMRPDYRENPDLPHLFIWESPDGSRVNTFKILFSYTDLRFDYNQKPEYADISAHKAKVLETRRQTEHMNIPFMSFYGVGNHGGGPSRVCVRELEALCAEDPAVRFSSPDLYFEDVNRAVRDLPVVTGDLQRHAIGCYSAAGFIKQKNRATENRLVSAEKYDVLSCALTGAPRHKDALDRAWKRLMFNQFHDILAGCCIKEALFEAAKYFDAAFAEGDETAIFALQRLAWHVNTSRGILGRPSGKEDWVLWEADGEGAPVVVFNPHAYPVTAPVQINRSRITGITDDEGNALPSQQVRGPQSNGGDFSNTLFITSLPALGWRTYYLYTKRTLPASPAHRVNATATSLENEFLRVKFNISDGTIESLIDKRTGVELISGGGAAALVIDDCDSDTWAHGKHYFRDVVGRFDNATAEAGDNGPLTCSLRITSRYGDSVLTQEFRLYSGIPQLFVEGCLDCREEHKIIKLAFPLNAECPAAAYEMPFGFINKPCTGVEEPGQRFVSLGGTDARGQAVRLALINSGKYSFSCENNELRMIVTRSCGFADHYSDRKAPIEIMEQGPQTFSYALLPHDGDMGGVTRAAMLFNQPVEMILGTNHDGELPTTFSVIDVSDPRIVCESLKWAEDGDAVILRLYETSGQAADARISLNIQGYECTFRSSFGRHELKTIRVKRGGLCSETNIIEQEEPV